MNFSPSPPYLLHVTSVPGKLSSRGPPDGPGDVARGREGAERDKPEYITSPAVRPARPSSPQRRLSRLLYLRQVFDYDQFLEKLTVVSGDVDDLSTHLTADMDDILSQNQLSRADSMAMAASRMARKARGGAASQSRAIIVSACVRISPLCPLLESQRRLSPPVAVAAGGRAPSHRLHEERPSRAPHEQVAAPGAHPGHLRPPPRELRRLVDHQVRGAAGPHSHRLALASDETYTP